jgi:hypothetical protein
MRWRYAATLAIGLHILTPLSARASWSNTPPALPAPAGVVVNVSTEAQLQSAVASLTSNTTIVIAPGTYTLSKTLNVRGPLTNVGIRGATTNRDDVVLMGAGRDNANYGQTPYGIWVDGDVKYLEIANLSIRELYYHPIIFNPGPTAPHVYNVHLVNGGQQLIKTNPNADGTGINDGIIEYSLFEYTPTSRDWYANAIQVLAGSGWIIRNNLIRNVQAPAGQQAGPAVLAWFSASNTIVEGNTFINCQREISFGLIDRTPNDNTGGIIRNNFIYRDASVQMGDVAIGVFDSPNTHVVHNTIVINGTYKNAIEYRFPDTSGVFIANNVADGGAIALRDSAPSATLQGNYLQSALGLFVDPPSGDLHLRSTASVIIGQGAWLADAPSDWDGQARPTASPVDLGADQYSASSNTAPRAPQNLRISGG